MMNFLLILAFLLVAITTSYLLHQHHLSRQQQARKQSLPLPPIDVASSSFYKQTIDINENKFESTSQNLVNWQQTISKMRKKGRTQAALNVCEGKYPLYSAYRQATLILRSILQDKNVDEPKVQEILSRLYKTAATAEMIHCKGSGGQSMSPAALKKLKMPLNDNFSIDYNELGYKEIPLLTKKDIKAIVSYWGEPEKHDSPRRLYQKYLN